MFFDDAITASRELNLTLTKRSNGMEHMPMCGVPYHSVDGYIAKLIKKGYRIAICEQVEDPKLAKGIVERKVIKIITPGTALNEQLLEDKQNRYLVFLQQDQEKGMCLAAADVTTGECEWFLDQTSERFKNIIDKYGDTENAMKQAGVIYASDQIIDLLANGVKNIHIYSMNKPEIAKGIQDNLKGIIL